MVTKMKPKEGISRVSAHGQITIPREIRKALALKEGTPLRILEERGRIVVIPQALVDRDQAWFWSREWQEKEREADEDIRAGRMAGPFNSVAAVKKDFEKRARRKPSRKSG